MKYQLLFLLTLVISCAKAQDNHLNLDNSIAVQGYDPISYFEGKAVEGKKAISAKHQESIYYFFSEEHKKTFLKKPSKYAPQYGGWCAYAMGLNGEKVKINPETFKIIDGKLYLFYNAFFNNTLKDWNKNEKQLKVKADKNWEIILNK